MATTGSPRHGPARRPTRTGPVALVVAATLLLGNLAAPLAAAGHLYVEPVNDFAWDTRTLDVVVLGVDEPVVIDAIRDAIRAWEEGIAELWGAVDGPVADPGDPPVIRSYVPGADVAPPPGFEPDDVEIYFVPQGFFVAHPAVVGVGQVCVATAPLSFEAAFGANAQYRVAAHEFGHCLILGHVFEHGSEYEPAFDLMGGGRTVNACPSNLNIMVMEKGFAGQQGEVAIPSADYVQSDCEGATPLLG